MNFFVMGLPKPQARPRSFSRGKFNTVYSPTTQWRNDVKYAAAQLNTVIKGPVQVEINYCFHRPKSHFRSGKNAHMLKESAPKFMTKRPDLDNLNKAVLDAIQDAGLLHDDSCVIYLNSHKKYVGKTFKQGAEIKINSIGGV